MLVSIGTKMLVSIGTNMLVSIGTKSHQSNKSCAEPYLPVGPTSVGNKEPQNGGSSCLLHSMQVLQAPWTMPSSSGVVTILSNGLNWTWL